MANAVTSAFTLRAFRGDPARRGRPEAKARHDEPARTLLVIDDVDDRSSARAETVERDRHPPGRGE